MPKKRQRKTRQRRRAPRKRQRRGRYNKASSLTIRTPTTIADRTFLKFKYTDLLNRVPAAAIDNYVWRGNSTFDPDLTGAGHQPFGFDQWCGANAFYQRYRVHGSKMELRISNDSTVGLALAIYPSLSTALPTTWQNAGEVPRAKVRVLGQNTGMDANILRTTYSSTKQIMGMKSITQDDLFTSIYTTNPVRQWYWIFTAQSTDMLTAALYQIAFTITYYVELYERTQIGQS